MIIAKKPNTYIIYSIIYLIPFLFEHTIVCVIGDSEYMRWQYWAHSLVLIESHIFRIVDWIKFERIQCNEYTAHIGVNVTGNKALTQIFQQSGFIQIEQLAQIGIFTIFGLY